jgi:hypothetical protein
MFSLQECVTLVTSHANRIMKVMAIDLASLSRFLQHACMVKKGLDLVSTFSLHDSGFWPQTSCLTTAFTKTLFFVCECLVFLLVALVCHMPSRNNSILEQTKAYQKEQQRLRTERRLAQLRQEQRQLELSEILYLLSIIWLVLIVAFYAKLYLGPQE